MQHLYFARSRVLCCPWKVFQICNLPEKKSHRVVFCPKKRSLFCPNFFRKKLYFAQSGRSRTCILPEVSFDMFVFCPKKKSSSGKIQIEKKVGAKYKLVLKVRAKYKVPVCNRLILIDWLLTSPIYSTYIYTSGK